MDAQKELLASENNEQMELQEQQYYKPNLIKTLYLSFSFMMLFTAFNSTQNQVSSVYSQLDGDAFKNLGNVQLIALYACFGGVAFFSAQIASKFSFKTVFIVSGLGYNIFIGLGFIIVRLCGASYLKDNQDFCSNTGAIYAMIIVGSMITGASAATIWVSQGGYLQSLSQQVGQRKSGFLIGCFWSILQLSQVIGNTLSYFLLPLDNGQVIYFETMICLGLIGNVMFVFLPSIELTEEQKKKQPIPELSMVVKIMKLKEIIPLYSLMAFTGVVVAFYTGFLSGLINTTLKVGKVATSTQIKQSASVFICLGVSEFISGMTTGKLTEKFNSYKLAQIGTIIAQIALILALVANQLVEFDYCYAIGILFGYVDCFFNSVVQIICTKDYPGRIEIFAIFRLVLALADSLILGVNIGVSTMDNKADANIIFIIVVFSFQILANVSSGFLQKPNMDQLSPESTDPLHRSDNEIDENNDQYQAHLQQSKKYESTKQN